MHNKVLIIDDAPDIVRLVEFELNFEGYEVKTAWTGKEGVELARSFKPDIILLDYILPEMTGPEVLKLLKSDPELKGIPVIMLSAKTQKKDIKSGLTAGAIGFIEKPFDPSALSSRMREILNAA